MASAKKKKVLNLHLIDGDGNIVATPEGPPLAYKGYFNNTVIKEWTKFVEELHEETYPGTKATFIDDLLEGKSLKKDIFYLVSELDKDNNVEVYGYITIRFREVIEPLEKNCPNWLFNIYSIGIDEEEDLEEYKISFEILINFVKNTLVPYIEPSLDAVIYENLRESNRLLPYYKEMGFETIENGHLGAGDKKEKRILVYHDFEDDITGEELIKLIDVLDKEDKKSYKPPTQPAYVDKSILHKDTKNKYQIKRMTSWKLDDLVKFHNKNLKRQRDKEYFDKILNKKKSIFYLVETTTAPPKIIGYIAARPEYSTLLSKKSGLYNTLNLVGIAVDEKHRKKGISTQLLKQMIKEAQSKDQFDYVYGHVRGNNIPALNLYRKEGFEVIPIGKYRDSGHKERKYRFTYIFKSPNYLRYWKEYKESVYLGLGILILHEFYHQLKRKL